MFTGIIGNFVIVFIKNQTRLEVKAGGSFMQKISEGLSISINGICLTVTSFNPQSFSVDFMPETEKKTNIGSLKIGDVVNLELPATPETFLSGHIVQGHVDTTAKLEKISGKGNSRILEFLIPAEFSKYLGEKGSIALSGISLTIISVKENIFTVGIIPHTLENTNLKYLKPGSLVNIEVDVLAKYVERLLQK